MTKNKIAKQWISAWNNHDLATIMTFYAEDIQHTSPSISTYYALPNNTIHGKTMLKTYFKMALEKNPTLHFNLLHITEGHQSLVLIYQRMKTKLAAEYLELNEKGLIEKSCSHYKIL